MVHRRILLSVLIFLLSSHSAVAEDSWSLDANDDELEAAQQILKGNSAKDQIQTQPQIPVRNKIKNDEPKRRIDTVTAHAGDEERKAEARDAAIAAEKKAQEEIEKCNRSMTIQPLNGTTFHFYGCADQEVVLKFLAKDACGNPVPHVIYHQRKPNRDFDEDWSGDFQETGDDGILSIHEYKVKYMVCHATFFDFKYDAKSRLHPNMKATVVLSRVVH